MKQKFLLIVFLTLLLFARITNAQIITLEDGTKIKLNDDKTFTFIEDSKDITKKTKSNKKVIYCKDDDGVFKYLLDTCYEGQVKITEDEYNKLRNGNSSNEDTRITEDENPIVNFIDIFDLNYSTINVLQNSTIQLLDVTIGSLSIKELIIEEPNTKYLNFFSNNTFDQDNDKYHGHFFEKLIIKDLSSVNNDLTIDYLELKRLDLKEIGLLKRLAIQEIEGDIKNISSIIHSFSLKSLIINKTNFTFGTEEYYYDSIILNNLKNSSIGELIYKNGKIIGNDYYTEVGLLEIKDLKFNSPDNYVDEFNYFEHPRDAFLFFDSLSSMSFENYYQELYEGYETFIVEIDNSEIKNIRTKKLDGLSIPVSYQHTGNGINVSSPTNDLFKKSLYQLGYDEIKFDYEIDINWNPGSKIFSFDFIFGMQDGADLEISMKFDDIDFVTLINDSLSPQISEYIQSEPKIKSVTVSLKDKGLTKKLLDVAADEMQINNDQVVSFIINQLESYSVFIQNPLIDEFIYSLQAFLLNPNRISFSINPPVSLSYNDINSLTEDPGLLIEFLNMKIR